MTPSLTKSSKKSRTLPLKMHIGLNRFRDLTKPAPRTEAHKWAAENRTHPNSTGVPGPRDPFLTPYIIEPERAVSEGKSRRVVMVFGAQTGKSEAILDLIGSRLDQRPAPVLYVGPNKQFLSEQFNRRLMELLDGCSSLAMKVARGKGMTVTRKIVAGVPLRLAHAGSSAALKSDPAALAMIDEYDEMGGNVQHQGAVLDLVELRGQTYADFCCVVTSTPSKGRVEAARDPASGLFFWDVAMKDDIESPIWELWQRGSRHHWCWPCPSCGEYFVPRFNLLRYAKAGTPMERANGVWMECPRNGCVITDEHKTSMNERGRYVAPGQTIGVDGVVKGDLCENSTLSYWVSGLASPFVTWRDRLLQYLEAIEMADDARAQTAINGGFGECYSAGSGAATEWQEVKQKSERSKYDRLTVPYGAEVLTLTVDVQKDHLPWVVRAWGGRATSWLVDYGKIIGDTAEIEVWERLANLTSETYEGVPISLTLVDAGFRPGEKEYLPTHRVLDFCRRMGKRVRPTRGSPRTMRSPLEWGKLDKKRNGMASKTGLDYVKLDSTYWKTFVLERMRWDEARPGGWMLPRGMDDDYCKQVVGEVLGKGPDGRPKWIERGRHHDFLDAEAMQAAAGYLLNVQRIPLRKNETGAMPSVGRKPELPNEGSTPPPPPPETVKAAEQKPRQVQARAPLRRGRRVFRSNYLGI